VRRDSGLPSSGTLTGLGSMVFGVVGPALNSHIVSIVQDTAGSLFTMHVDEDCLVNVFAPNNTNTLLLALILGQDSPPFGIKRV